MLTEVVARELRVRIGLHTGELVREADDFYGKAVILPHASHQGPVARRSSSLTRA
jgi:hypothetical protein